MPDEITKPIEEQVAPEKLEPVSEPVSEPIPTEVEAPQEVEQASPVEEVVIDNPTPEPVTTEVPVVSSPPARSELGEGTQVQDSLRSFDEKKSNEWTVPVREMPKAEEVSESNPTPLVTSPSSLETSTGPRPYSLDPKLNKMIEGFVRGMNRAKENLILARASTKAKMMKKVYKIMDLFKKQSPASAKSSVEARKITNDDVEKFLHTDDTTATRYLNILTKEGKIKREGSPHSPHYTKVE